MAKARGNGCTVYSVSGIRGKTEWMSDGNAQNIVSIPYEVAGKP